MKELFKKYLLKAKKENKLVSFRTNTEETEKFSVGYIIGINDEIVNVKSVNPNGLSDGILMIRLKDIYEIDTDDKYIRRLELKIKNQKKILRDISVPPYFYDYEYNMFLILQKSKEENQLIYINFYHGGFYGYVKELTQEELLFEIYTEYGEYDGLSVFLIEDIKNIILDDIDNRSVELQKK